MAEREGGAGRAWTKGAVAQKGHARHAEPQRNSHPPRPDGLPRRPLPLPPRNDKLCSLPFLPPPCHREGRKPVAIHCVPESGPHHPNAPWQDKAGTQPLFELANGCPVHHFEAFKFGMA